MAYTYKPGKYSKTDDTDQTIGVNNSLVRSANVNSNENSTVSAASLTKSGSSDEFKFNPAMEQRILAAKDRQNMRQQARVRRASGGSEIIESQYLKQPNTQETYINRRGKEKKSKLYKHNLNVQERINKGLDKKSVQPVSTGGSTVTNSSINNVPPSVITNVSGVASLNPKPKPPNMTTPNIKSSSGSYTLSSTKDKPISGTESAYTPHALSTPEGRNTIANQVGAKNPSNFAKAHEIKDEKERDKAEIAAVDEDQAIFNLLFPDY